MTKDNSLVKEAEALREMRTLEAIEANPYVSQREMAANLGVALGIANACVHTLARKGMIKIRGENNRSVTYHITKKGVGHKSTLAMQWTLNTVDFYREARVRVSATLSSLAASGVKRLVLWGASELAEIAYIAARPVGIEIVGVVGDPESYIKDSLVEVPIGGEELLVSVKPDAIAITLLQPTDEIIAVRDEICALVPGLRVVGIFDGEV